MQKRVKIIGGGLAGCEAAYQLAKRGIKVELYEMKPHTFSPAHHSENLAEVVCSNSFKSMLLSTASGALKEELTILNSLILKIAKECAVPAGSALAVDREEFSKKITEYLENLENVEIIRKEVAEINTNEPTIIATGPLTSDKLGEEIKKLLGEDGLHFYDASSPIVDISTVDLSKTFSTSRYQKGDSDYINCPMDKETYYAFIDELVNAKRAELHEFEKSEIFEGCMPVEVMASRGKDTLRYGPLRPVGLLDNEGKRPYAVVQLRKESVDGDLYNIVGFQTNLLFGEQKRVFSMIPALEDAEFVKFGVMHRNSYINSPKHLNPDLSLKKYPLVFFAGQITGVEGYMESTISGLISGINMANKLLEKQKIEFNNLTITGALCNYICSENQNFQPMNANFGILSPLEVAEKKKVNRKEEYSKRAINEMIRIKEAYKIDD